jgi:hypothetical protein
VFGKSWHVLNDFGRSGCALDDFGKSRQVLSDLCKSGQALSFFGKSRCVSERSMTSMLTVSPVSETPKPTKTFVKPVDVEKKLDFLDYLLQFLTCARL